MILAYDDRDRLRARIAELEARWASTMAAIGGVAGRYPYVAPIVADAATATGVSRQDLVSARRGADLSRVRFAVYWAAKTATPVSLATIGRAIGDRDHSSIIHGIKRAETLRRDDPVFRTLCDLLVAKAEARSASADIPKETAS